MNLNGPQNAIIGDDNYGTELPETETDAQALKKLQNTARFSKTTEFKELKSHLEGRIKYYETYLPGNVPAENVPDEERGKYWAIANIIISEFNGVINAYEEAARQVKDATPQSKS